MAQLSLLVAAAALASQLFTPVLGQWCIPLGPVFPPPHNVVANPLMRAAVANMTATLDALSAGRMRGVPYRANTTYSSVGMTSVHDNDGAAIFQHHHAPPGGLANSTAQADAHTVYRIGSVTKVFTVLALLLNQKRLSLDDPVTKWLPNLAQADTPALGDSSVERVAWHEVTLGALASHLAGIGTNCE
jgi:CubicO group peptidase (beta-lactamase class C family)